MKDNLIIASLSSSSFLLIYLHLFIFINPATCVSHESQHNKSDTDESPALLPVLEAPAESRGGNRRQATFRSNRYEGSVWSAWSQCSRRCGGGLKKRTRSCLTSFCNEALQEYSICNENKCSSREKEFRFEQCAKRNGKYPDKGLRWVPLPGHTTCELKCKSVELGKIYAFGKADDGTKCKQDGDHVCLDGRCMPVGCDLRINSSKVMDDCGVCGGHNSTCKIRRGIFRKKFNNTDMWANEIHLSDTGYQEVVEIPSGATFIKVKDQSGNYLALQDSRGKFVINGAKTFSWAGVYDIDGVTVNYSRVGDEETFLIDGPLKEPLKIMVLIVAENTGISFQYSMSKHSYNQLPVTSNGGRKYDWRPSPTRISPPVSDRRRQVPKTINNEVNNSGRRLDKAIRDETARSTPPPHKRRINQTTSIPRATTPIFVPVAKNKTDRPLKPERPYLKNNTYFDYNVNRIRNISHTNEISNRKNYTKGVCEKCVRVKERLKNFCTSAFVIRGKILRVDVLGHELRYDVHVIETFRNIVRIDPREYIWNRDLCKCPKLRVGIEYIIMGDMDDRYRPNESRLLVDRSSFTRKFIEKRGSEMRRLRENPKRCYRFENETKQ